MKQLLLPALAALALLATTGAHANNIQVTNPTLINGTGGNATIQFDLSWENSWRGGGVSNWDAAWVFVKYYSGVAWHHANLNNSGHVAATGSQIDLGLLTPGTAYNANSNPVVGVFVYRNADGTGNLSLPGTQLSWNYGALGLAFNDISKVQVFAIEMVYVPQGSFAAGAATTTGGEYDAFTLTTINTADATAAPGGTGSLGGQAGGYPTGQVAPTAAGWPNGYTSFYCMKYELSQQGYVDFLNTLTYPQQVTRTITDSNSITGAGALSSSNAYRNGIDVLYPSLYGTTSIVFVCNLNGNSAYGENSDGSDIACNWLSWADLTAFLDWSGLRPMTELEFEKSCRGPLLAIPGEFPWGSNSGPTAPLGVVSQGLNNEGISGGYMTNDDAGNALTYETSGYISGPVRVGIFAANSANTGRKTSGAGYYGIMELAGNVFEQVVSIANVGGNPFTGNHGNGVLNATGQADALDWPTQHGFGIRGGAFRAGGNQMRVADRLNAGDQNALVGRTSMNGGRGVRSAQ